MKASETLNKRRAVLLETDDIDTMEEYINNLLAQGYEFVGSLVVTPLPDEPSALVFHQTMLKS